MRRGYGPKPRTAKEKMVADFANAVMFGRPREEIVAMLIDKHGQSPARAQAMVDGRA